MGLEEKVGLNDLFRFRGVTEQLDEGIKDIGSSWAEYRRDINGVTQRLIEAGYVKKPRGIEGSVESILNANDYVVILGEGSGMLIEGNKRVLSKTGPLLKVPRRYSIAKEERETKNVRNLLVSRLKKVKLGDFYVGFDFQGVHYANQQYRVVPLVDLVRACILDNEIPDDLITINFKFEPSFIPDRGLNFIINNVPSVSGKTTPYKIRISHIPVYSGKKPSVKDNETSFDITTLHNCAKTIYDIKFARGLRKGDEILLDFHVILAFKKAKKAFEGDHSDYRIIDPFLEPDSITRRFFWNCLERTLIEYKKEGHVKRKPLTLLETEVYLWDLVGYRNSKRK